MHDDSDTRIIGPVKGSHLPQRQAEHEEHRGDKFQTSGFADGTIDTVDDIVIANLDRIPILGVGLDRCSRHKAPASIPVSRPEIGLIS